MDDKKNGKKVLEELKEVYPDIKVIFISALSEISKIAKELKVDYIEKPFDIKNLLLKINSII